MKTHAPLAWLVCLSLSSSLTLSAQETAVVKDGKINVRGQPSLVGEVITQLQKGEKVVVLETIPAPKARTNEPARWARIQMPANTPVWVFSQYLDPAEKTVKVSRINLRAGPGENYSIVGRLERGAKVNEIRKVENWTEIETPPGAYAFVAADLLTKSEGEAVAAVPAKPEPAPAPVTPAPKPEPVTPPVTAPPAVATPAPTKTEPEPSVVAAAPAPSTVTPATPESAAPTPAPAPVAAESTPATSAAAQPIPVPAGVGVLAGAPEEAPIKRIVRREGLVRSTVSIQAPTYYELLNPKNRKTINYLHTPSNDIRLKDYRGRRIVVTGEEAIDPRWPKTPVIEVETLELIP